MSNHHKSSMGEVRKDATSALGVKPGTGEDELREYLGRKVGPGVDSSKESKGVPVGKLEHTGTN